MAADTDPSLCGILIIDCTHCDTGYTDFTVKCKADFILSIQFHIKIGGKKSKTKISCLAAILIPLWERVCYHKPIYKNEFFLPQTKN